jgi:hypothetical protein
MQLIVRSSLSLLFYWAEDCGEEGLRELCDLSADVLLLRWVWWVGREVGEGEGVRM